MPSPELHTWLESLWGPAQEEGESEEDAAARQQFQRHIASLLANRVTGNQLCTASDEWVYNQIRTDPSDLTGSLVQPTPMLSKPPTSVSMTGPTPSPSAGQEQTRQEAPLLIEGKCSRETEDSVQQAVDLWIRSKRPVAAVKKLSGIAQEDGQCCSPFREFSRLFLGPNAPIADVNNGTKEQLLRVLRSQQAPGQRGRRDEGWRMLAAYGEAQLLFLADDMTSASDIVANTLHPNRSVFTHEIDRNAEEQHGAIVDRIRESRIASRSHEVRFSTVASDDQREAVRVLQESAEVAGVRLDVLGARDPYHGHETKLRLYHDWVQNLEVPDEALVVLIDAYDVLLGASAGSIGERFRAVYPKHGVVFAAERSLWPDAALEPAYPLPPTIDPSTLAEMLKSKGQAKSGARSLKSKKAPQGWDWSSTTTGRPRYLNSGTIIGYRWAVEYMLATLRLNYGAVALCGPDDQRSFHRFFLEHRHLVTLDYHTVLFQTLHMLYESVTVDSGGDIIFGAGDALSGGSAETFAARNQLNDWIQTPCAVHGNGGDGKSYYDRLSLAWRRVQRSGGSEVEVVEPLKTTEAKFLYLSGDLEGAAAAYAIAGETISLPLFDRAESVYNLAVVRAELGEFDEATKAYRKALNLLPDNIDAMLNLAILISGMDPKARPAVPPDGTDMEVAYDLVKDALKVDPAA